MEFYVHTNTKELDKNIKPQGCPSDLQENFKAVVTYYWDVFCEDGFLRPIRVFSFRIETGNHPPIWFEPPMYFPHESEVMQNLVGRMDENGMVE